MGKQIKSITELLSDEEIKLLTEEAFSTPKVKRVDFSKYKAPLTIAASLVLMVGILNYETVSAKTAELFAYIFAVGIQEQRSIENYFVLNESVMLNENVTVTGLYRYDHKIQLQLKAINEEVISLDNIALKINGKLYQATEGKSVVSNTLEEAGQDHISQVESMILEFSSVPNVNQLTIVWNQSEVATVELKQPNFVNQDDIYETQVGGNTLSALPLTQNNDMVAFQYEIESVGNIPWIAWLHGAEFVDELGQKTYAMTDYMNHYELTPLDPSGNKIVKLIGNNVTLRKDFQDIINLNKVKFSIPNPSDGETLVLDQAFEIDGISFTVHEVSRLGSSVSIVFDRTTSYGELEDLFYYGVEPSGGILGSHDDLYIYSTHKEVDPNLESLEFYVNEFVYRINQDFEISFE